MSFKEDAKAELLTALPEKECCVKAFLSAVARVSGSIELSKRRLNLAIRLDSYEEGMKIAELFKRVYPTEVELSLYKNPKNDKLQCKLLIPSGFAKEALVDLELMSADGDALNAFIEGIPQQLLVKECCRISYFKGLFFAAGSAYVPLKSADDEQKNTTGYHFELSLEDETFADDVMELMSDLRINTRMSDRGERKLVYVKDKDEMLSALCLLGLSDCALRLKGIIEERETANSLNRAVICETANLDKTLSASARQIAAIQMLQADGRFDSLPAPLRETALMRVAHTDASLSELADILGVSKSCLNHRLRRLSELAET